MGNLRTWLRTDFPWYLRGFAGGAGIAALSFLVITPRLWFIPLGGLAFAGACYTVAVMIDAHTKHKALMAADFVWVTTYQYKGQVMDYDKRSGLYHVWTDARGAVSSGWFRADVLEPLNTDTQNPEP